MDQVNRSPDRHVFNLRPKSANQALRILGIVDLVAGVFLFLSGVLTAIKHIVSIGPPPPPIGLSVVFLVFGLAAVYSGIGMAFGAVIVTPDRIKTWNYWWRSVPQVNIDRIDVLRINTARGSERAMPTVFLRDGQAVELQNVAWTRPREGFISASRGLPLQSQQAVIDEIRKILGTGGTNFQPGSP
jgi:hypothetical protein